ncbi:hypothetical protein DYB28_008764 [Aphanomyces astaci]|uniref:DDE-1 domain-containing protein n=1 Tax=Aphanomyces astaci TaxID=112090 RepID=A0A396ZYS4_APHAT|nr:hypothetical protein DYB25_003572 [Aphanomyces astaci]RHY08938.1 hypothetical protein DYB36_002859 [Aphanomyces astaci]RLO05347.1 hypothetical protein DYB28_008764 [Aphanomyces astaci]
MDEMSFSPTKMTTKVVLHRSTKSVYVEEATALSHATIVACIGADGSKLPPLFIVPRDRVLTDVCDSLVIPGASVTTSEKGWTNSYICRKWLVMLHASIPSITKPSILLILDGCSSHDSTYINDEAEAISILLLFLPANSTRMFQPLDVTVFRPFKQAMRAEVANKQWADFLSCINKQQAVSIACRVWAMSTKESSITNRFICTGLCPPSLANMLYRLSIFKPSENQEVEIDNTWLKRTTTLRNDLLFLLPEKKMLTVRKTLTIREKLITADYHAILQARSAARPNARKRNQRNISAQEEIVEDFAQNDEDIVELCII